MNMPEQHTFDFAISDKRLKAWVNQNHTDESFTTVLKAELEEVTHAYFMVLGSYGYALACSPDPALQRDPSGKDISRLVDELYNWRENLKLALEHAQD